MPANASEECGNVGRAGQPVQVAEAEQQERRREDAQQEVLDRRFLGRPIVPRQVEQHVGRDADQFQRQEQRDEFVGRRRQAHAGDDDQQAGVILGGQPSGTSFQVEQHQDDRGRRAMPMRMKIVRSVGPDRADGRIEIRSSMPG